MLTLLCNLHKRQSLNEGMRMREFHKLRVFRSLSLTSGQRLPTKKGPQRRNPRMRSRFTTITLLLSNEHAPPLTCGLSVYSLFRVAVISFVAEKSRGNNFFPQSLEDCNGLFEEVDRNCHSDCLGIIFIP